MKILYLITKATWGGAQRYVWDMTTRAPEGVVPVVAYGTAGRLSEMLAKDGIETYAIPSLVRDVSTLSDIKSFLEIVRCIRTIRPDVLHLNSSKAAALGALAGRMCGVKKIVFTAHGWPFKEPRSAFTRCAIYAISWATALLAHEVIVISKKDEEIGKKMWLVGRRARYIPLAIEPPAFLTREKSSFILSLNTSAPRIITIAELTPNKGIRYAIEAVAILKERGTCVEYFIMGDGEERVALQCKAKECGVADRVHFLGFVPDAATYLKAFDIFLLPSLKEGAPYVLLEAAEAGLPIIATAAVDAAPHITRVAPANAMAIANTIACVKI